MSEAFQGRSAAARDGVAKIFSRKLFVTSIHIDGIKEEGSTIYMDD